ncbi:MAG: hypothetical protein MUO60_18200 [Clostridiaceae bacterium]|nr:hypothetical protein [Clostridiaceae bacterium]
MNKNKNKNKNNTIKLLNEIKSFTFFKEATEIDMDLRERECIGIKCYGDRFVDIDFYDNKDGITMLYKDRKD